MQCVKPDERNIFTRPERRPDAKLAGREASHVPAERTATEGMSVMLILPPVASLSKR